MFNKKLIFLRVILVHEFPTITILPVTAVFILLFSTGRREILLGISLLFIGIIYLTISSVQRYRRITLLLEQGHKRKGEIIEKYSRWNRTYVAYEYKYRGQVYRAGEHFSPSPVLSAFKIGQDINIFIDKKSPSHSLFYDIYL